MFPGFMSMIAIFILLFQLGLLDTHAAMILVYTAGAPVLGTFVVKGFFDTIPRSLEEAARIDGASNFTVFSRIIIPLSRPMLTYVGLTTFYGAWVDFIFARLVLRSKENWTVAVGLWDMVANFQNSNFTMFAAASVLIAVPITILFIYLQRFLVDGLTAGANKG
jgi:arabinogalactan oligomer/maltooligosaccharide transport system permease protein